MENFRLKVFCAVAENLNFRKAAEALYLTQPAVTLQIKALEEELGSQLLDRTGSRVALTPAGKVLLKYAQRIAELAHQAEAEIAALSGAQSGVLRLGASTTIAQYLLPRLLGEFRKEHPRVRLSIISGNTEQIVEALVEQKIGIGLIEGPPLRRDVRAEPFFEDELVLTVPASHEWAEQGSIHPRQLADAPLLMREHGSGTRRVVEMALTKYGLKTKSLSFAMELDSTEAIISSIEAGLGVGFISVSAIAKAVALGSVRVVAVSGLRILRQLCLVYPSGPEPNGAAGAFRRFALHCQPSLRDSLEASKAARALRRPKASS